MAVQSSAALWVDCVIVVRPVRSERMRARCAAWRRNDGQAAQALTGMVERGTQVRIARERETRFSASTLCDLHWRSRCIDVSPTVFVPAARFKTATH